MNNLLDYILETEDIFKPVTDEEIPIRRKQYLKSVFDKVNITKNDDGTVNINGDLDLSNMGITSLLDLPYKIRKITGSFDCAFNKLTTLEGAPRIVGRYFNCFGNQLTTLEGAPDYVGGWFYYYGNNLPEDVKVPSKVKGEIY